MFNRTKNYARIREGVELTQRVIFENENFGLTRKEVPFPHKTTLIAIMHYLNRHNHHNIGVHVSERHPDYLAFRVYR